MMGDGLALLDPLLFHEEIKAGRLVRPFDLWLDEGYGYYLTTHPEDLSNEAVALVPLLAHRAVCRRRDPRAPEPEPAPEAPKLQAAPAEPPNCARRNRARPSRKLTWADAILARAVEATPLERG